MLSQTHFLSNIVCISVQTHLRGHVNFLTVHSFKVRQERKKEESAPVLRTIMKEKML
jgi:hypothetical protein